MNNTFKINHFSKRLSRQIIQQYFVSVAVFLIIMLILFVVSAAMLSSRLWYGTELLYPYLKFISDHRIGVLLTLSILGAIIIFIPYWVRTLGYLEQIINATSNVYDSRDNLIQLPGELNDVEKQLNQIKLNIRHNEQAAREAEQRKNDLVVYLAHDLKTPLTSVIGYLTLLHDEQEISPELRSKYLSIAQQKAERLEDLINEFFEITRFNLTNPSLELSRINLSRMLEQLVFEFQPALKEKGLQCKLDLPPDIMVLCDPNKLQRAFDNLLRNAVNYSFEGTTIEIIAAQAKDTLKLRFLNHGNTIPKDKLNRIFEQFYRLDTARTSKTGGAGLGLAIAKQIIELHHGTISAVSESELVTFDITLPIL